jgi:TRAP-type uncharacterized transport system substrate-binding protein
MSAALAADRITIAVGPDQSIQPEIATDIARFVGPAAGLDMIVQSGAGAADSVQRLLDVPGVRMALLPADTAFAFADAARRGNVDATRLMAPVRVITPLYRQSIYLIVRADSAFNSLRDIKDAHINVGPIRSDSALTAVTLYRLMFDTPIADDRISFLDDDDALARLTGDRSIDVVIITGEQPARLLANMKSAARRFIKLLRFDAASPVEAAALSVYDVVAVRATSYPNLLDEDLPALATPVYLVTYGPRREEDDGRLARFAKAWCQQLPVLRDKGQPLWHEVELAPGELKTGWHYAATALRQLTECSGGTVPTPPACSQQERVLGLCR